MELCDVIRTRRLELGLTLGQIADACGVGTSIVAKWERGEVSNLRRNNIKSLADVLQVSPLVLLDREEPPLNVVSDSEMVFIKQFRSLDPRGQSAVLNTLAYEYQAMQGDGHAPPLSRNA